MVMSADDDNDSMHEVAEMAPRPVIPSQRQFTKIPLLGGDAPSTADVSGARTPLPSAIDEGRISTEGNITPPSSQTIRQRPVLVRSTSSLEDPPSSTTTMVNPAMIASSPSKTKLSRVSQGKHELSAAALESHLNLLAADFRASLVLNHRHAYTLSIHSTFKAMWDAGLLVATFVAAIVGPLDASFDVACHRVSVSLDTLFLVDMLLMFRTSFLDDVTREEITDPVRIRTHYVTTWLLLDAVGSIPTSYLAHHASLAFLCYARFAVLTRFGRLRYSPMLQRLLAWMSLVMHTGALRLVGLAILYLVLHHYIACAYYLLVCAEGDAEELWEIPFTREDSIEIKYIGSYFQAVTVTGGFTLYPKTNAERLFGGFMFVVGAAANAWYQIPLRLDTIESPFSIFGTVASLLQTINKVDDARGHRMERVHAHLRRIQVADVLERQIMECHNSAEGVARAHHTAALFDGLPPKLTLQLQLHLHQTFLNKVPLFQTLPQDALLALLESMDDVVASNGDVIIRAGEGGEAFYMVESGTVQVFEDDPTLGRVVLQVLAAGDFFGEVSLMRHGPASATVVATSLCKFHVIYRETFDRVMLEHAHLKVALEKSRTRRLQSSQTAKHEAGSSSRRPLLAPKTTVRRKAAAMRHHFARQRMSRRVSEQLSVMETKLSTLGTSTRHTTTAAALHHVCHMSHIAAKRMLEAKRVSAENVNYVA
ncbi:Aste57867_21393 [Aphanomyces stellatus]|uniref:Aste57867_21393 protein n=1 Tax=Aphanomyces stellatus TaxID=120398 RepID=A0A485LI07_9STRA|nr:hypothetical protein As57867_021324 [Aphanomyces stellatus]VFT98064.1 Aste57867_21393 [Aphanomyces stellatus]